VKGHFENVPMLSAKKLSTLIVWHVLLSHSAVAASYYR